MKRLIIIICIILSGANAMAQKIGYAGINIGDSIKTDSYTLMKVDNGTSKYMLNDIDSTFNVNGNTPSCVYVETKESIIHTIIIYYNQYDVKSLMRFIVHQYGKCSMETDKGLVWNIGKTTIMVNAAYKNNEKSICLMYSL